MRIHYFKLPNYKGYLYDLRERIRILKKINLRKWVPGFYVKPGDFLIIKNCLIKFGKGGAIRKQRANIYNEFVKVVEVNQSRVLSNEYGLAVRLSRIKKLKMENIMSELAELKKFAKEVGMGISDYKSLDEDELITAIIQKVDPKKQKYSSEFVAWYDELSEDIFNGDSDKKDKDTKKKGKEKEEPKEDEIEFDKDEVVDAIENADKIKELYEVVDMFPDVFPEKLKKIKDMTELQEKMLEKVEEATEEEKVKSKGSSKEKIFKKKDKDEESDDKSSLTKAEKKEIIGLIQESDDIADLRSFCKEYSDFEDIELRGKATLESLQKRMLTALGVEFEDNDDEKPTKAKGKKKSKESNLEEELSEMSLIELKKLAKEQGIKVPLGTSKTDTIEIILEATENDKDEKEIELNPSIIKQLVKEKDLESLQKAASAMKITLKALEKRNAKAIGEKLIEALSEIEEKPTKTKGKKENVSAWETVKIMLEDNIKSSTIVKAIVVILEEMGIDEDEAEDKAKVLIEIAKAESK